MFVKIAVSTDRCGTDLLVYAKFPDDTTNEEINNYCDGIAYSNYESYSFDEEDEMDEEESGIEYIPDEHYFFSWKKIDTIPEGAELVDFKIADDYCTF